MLFYICKEILIIINNIIYYNFIFKIVIICRILFIMIVGICIIIYICYNYGYYFEVVCRGIVNFEDFLIELLVNIE